MSEKKMNPKTEHTTYDIISILNLFSWEQNGKNKVILSLPKKSGKYFVIKHGKRL